MTSANKTSRQFESEHLGLERLVFFSDAVFAIAITLLALEIRLPQMEAGLGEAGLQHNLFSIWPKYLGYFISFMVIGSFWISHHRKFLLIRRYDRRLLYLNLFLLMIVAFIPFPTSVISEYPNRVGVIFYAVTIALTGGMSALIWWYTARKHHLVDAELSEGQIRRELISPLSISAVFLFSIGLALFNSDAAMYSWLLLLPVFYLSH